MKFKSLLAATALAGSATLAMGTTIPLVPSGTGMYSATFTQTVDDGSIIDDFDFDLLSFSGLVSVTLTSLTGPVSFDVGAINGQGFGNLTDDPYHFSFQALVTADMPLTLTVLRAVEDADHNPIGGTGSYSVALTAAVPEPQTWALLLAGLTGIGFAARRRHAVKV